MNFYGLRYIFPLIFVNLISLSQSLTQPANRDKDNNSEKKKKKFPSPGTDILCQDLFLYYNKHELNTIAMSFFFLLI